MNLAAAVKSPASLVRVAAWNCLCRWRTAGGICYGWTCSADHASAHLRIPTNRHRPLPSRLKSSMTKPTKATAKNPLKIALVEDQPKARDNWCRLINSFPDLSCICVCKSGEEALRLIPEVPPDVILMDIFLPRMSGIECTAQLKAILPQTQIIILT